MSSSRPQNMQGSRAFNDFPVTAGSTMHPPSPAVSDDVQRDSQRRSLEHHRPANSGVVLPPIRTLLSREPNDIAMPFDSDSVSWPPARKRVFQEEATHNRAYSSKEPCHPNVYHSGDPQASRQSSTLDHSHTPRHASRSDYQRCLGLVGASQYSLSAEKYSAEMNMPIAESRVPKRARVGPSSGRSKRVEDVTSSTGACSGSSSSSHHLPSAGWMPHDRVGAPFARAPTTSASAGPPGIPARPQHRRPSLSQRSDSSHYTNTSASGSATSFSAHSYPRSALGSSQEAIRASTSWSGIGGRSNESLTPPSSYHTTLSPQHLHHPHAAPRNPHPVLPQRGFPSRTHNKKKPISGTERVASWVSRFDVSLTLSHISASSPSPLGTAHAEGHSSNSPSTGVILPFLNKSPHMNQSPSPHSREPLRHPEMHHSEHRGRSFNNFRPSSDSESGGMRNSAATRLDVGGIGIRSEVVQGTEHELFNAINDNTTLPFVQSPNAPNANASYPGRYPLPYGTMKNQSMGGSRLPLRRSELGKDDQDLSRPGENNVKERFPIAPDDEPYEHPSSDSHTTSGSYAIKHFKGQGMGATDPSSCSLSSFLPPLRSKSAFPSNSGPYSHGQQSTLRALTHPKVPAPITLDDSVNEDNIKEGNGQRGDEEGDDVTSKPVYAISDSSSSDALRLMDAGSGAPSRKLWELPLIISN